jgi:hypothetical protein
VSDFNTAYSAWSQRVDSDPSLLNSSVIGDFTRLPEYQEIIQLGAPALPNVMRKLEDGDYLLNTAAFAIAGIDRDDVVPDPDEYYSELDISKFLLDWWRTQAAGAP